MHLKTKILDIEAAEVDALNELMSKDEQVEGYRRDEIIKEWTVKIDKDYEVDIKVCNGDAGAWVDAVLFLNGGEIECLEPSTDLDGEYHFIHSNVMVCVPYPFHGERREIRG